MPSTHDPFNFQSPRLTKPAADDKDDPLGTNLAQLKAARDFFLTAGRLFVWGLFLLAALVVMAVYLVLMKSATTAIHEASIPANACLWLVLAYTVARAIDSITRWRS